MSSELKRLGISGVNSQGAVAQRPTVLSTGKSRSFPQNVSFQILLWWPIHIIIQLMKPNYMYLLQGCCLKLPNKYFKEAKRAKAEKLGAQQVMCWELLQKLKVPKSFSWVPQAVGLL